LKQLGADAAFNFQPSRYDAGKAGEKFNLEYA
jgi:hypothetical protein